MSSELHYGFLLKRWFNNDEILGDSYHIFAIKKDLPQEVIFYMLFNSPVFMRIRSNMSNERIKSRNF